MAVTKLTSTLGEITTNFYLNDMTAYIMNTSATGGYVGTDWEILGYTSAEKTINFLNEVYTREDKIPRVPTYEKTIRKGMEITAGLSNLNEELLGIVIQGTNSSLGATGTRIAVGTNEPAVEYRCVRFAGQRDDNQYFSITIPKCKITFTGELTVGGESEVVQEYNYKAFNNTISGISATANLYIVNMWASNISPTNDTAIGYN